MTTSLRERLPLSWRKKQEYAIVIGFFVALGTGCAAQQPLDVESPDVGISWLESGETIALLSSPQFHFDWSNKVRATRVDPLECARKAFEEEGVANRLLSEETFKREAFPDLPPDAAPTDPESLKLLLTHPTLLARIEPLNLRYLVYAMSETEIRNANEVWGGVVSYQGGAFVGWESWEQSSEFSFLIVDAKAVRDVASAETREHGTGWWSAGLVVVVPFGIGYESPTEQAACEEMTRKLRETLREHGTR